MQQQNHPELVHESDSHKTLAQGDENLNAKVETYRWLFWAAVFLIVVLLVALFARNA